MKRPEQHETDSDADALFRATFSKWAITPSERDYGWDYIVEFFKEHESTGVMFAGQLKGSRHSKCSADDTFISQPLEQDAADYLARQLEQPTFLFQADVIAKRLFWSAIQLDQNVLASLEKGETKSLTVRIPTANLLPDGMERFLSELTRSKISVISRVLLGTKPIEVVDAMAKQPVERLSEMADDFHVKGFQLELQVAHQRFRKGEVDGAIAAVKKVLAESSSYIEVQFNGTLQLGELEVYKLMKSAEPQARVPKKKLEIALKLCGMAKREPRYLHLAAQLQRRAAELAVSVQKTFGLLMIWRGHQKRGDDPLWLAVLSVRVYESLLAAFRAYRRALRLAQATANSRYRSVTSRPIGDVALSIEMLARVLESCELTEIALGYHQSALQLLHFAAAIATEHGSKDDLYTVLMVARTLERDKNGGIFKWVRSMIEQWPPDDEYRRNAEELLTRAVARLDGARFEGDIETTPRQIHHNILTSAGIDPTEEPWASFIDLAIKDDDPTRVLIECEHKVVMRHPASDPMLDRWGLDRANPKIIGCNIYRYSLGGRSLDDIDQEFKTRFCSTCLKRSPRPVGWSFYDELL